MQDDKYPVLCQHAGQELVDEFVTISFEALSSLNLPSTDPHVFDGFSYWFGIVIGSFPELFCSGVDPMLAIKNLMEKKFGVLPLPKGGAKGWYKSFIELSDKAKSATSKAES